MLTRMLRRAECKEGQVVVKKQGRSGELAITEKCRELSRLQKPPPGPMPNGARRFGELNSHKVCITASPD